MVSMIHLISNLQGPDSPCRAGGVVGTGTWLGESVDMRKDPSGIPESQSIPSPTLSGRSALANHISENAWRFIDAEDEINTGKLMIAAKRDNSLSSLPLRDQVREDPLKRKEAAFGWSSIYGAFEGESSKSALEVSIEKLVRRVPLVVFSRTACP